MDFIVGPKEKVGRNGGSFQECTVSTASILTGNEKVDKKFGRYCTIKDNEYAPPTKQSGRKWVQIFRTPDDTE